jgi:hypothetical protein
MNNPNIPDQYMAQWAIEDFEGTVKRGTLNSREAQEMHAAFVAGAVLRGDLLWARSHAITLALHRDNRSTLDEMYARRDALVELDV